MAFEWIAKLIIFTFFFFFFFCFFFMFPLYRADHRHIDEQRRNTKHLFQIWIGIQFCSCLCEFRKCWQVLRHSINFEWNISIRLQSKPKSICYDFDSHVKRMAFCHIFLWFFFFFFRFLLASLCSFVGQVKMTG